MGGVQSSTLTHVHDATRVILCSHVVDDGLPILQVVHEDDGDWQFLCGGDHVSRAQIRSACWTCTMEQDSSLEAVSTLQAGRTALRKNKTGRWQIIKNARANP